MRGTPAAPASWWRAARAAGPGRLAYEIALAVTLAGVTAGLALVRHQAPSVIAGLALLDVVLIGLRHRLPATVLVVTAVVGTMLGRLDTVLLFGLGFSAGYRIRAAARLAGTLAAVLACQIGGQWLKEGTTSLPQVLFTAGVFIVAVVFPATLARLSAQRRRILTLMHERTVHLSEQQQIVAERARVREANRIAREMHDSLGHRLTLISLYTGALRSAPDRPEETLRLLHATSTSAMDELRDILAVLRVDSPDDEPRQHATLADTERLIADTRAAGVDIAFVRSGEAVTVPAMVDQAAYRTVQEGITNAVRHARGGVIRSAVRYEDDALVVEVVNGPGRAYDGATSGQGLYGLAERVRIAGGVLYHGAEPDGGFRIAATLPLSGTTPRTLGVKPAAPDEFGDDLRRVDQRRRAWTVTVALSVLLVIALCAGGLWLGVSRQTVSRATYDQLRVGDSAVVVRKKLPDRTAELDPGTTAPPAPPGADCVAYRAAPVVQGPRDEGYRFCFRAGALISKEELDDAG
ncbi:sensor histidine kinase [Winogradskya humida]|uniref:histidine kinase n=1 Tax=Winogradskya humida TaxID=113566 RepID=A0ABQ4A5P7_9ACTN|nr:histidine kinase [Actinoplanes humidus]GIE26163.1 two-component sensor histidine kinase [Actinoplanes humidus]